MTNWNKKNVSKSEVEELTRKYGVDPLTASIMVRRNIVEGNQALYLMEDDLRFQHRPFLFKSMEEAVDRILEAKEENEKVLIFGDKDVDGITSTVVLYDCLVSMGMDVRYRLPTGDDAYGLSLEAVDDFEKEGGSLIITVDCGISNNKEIAYAAEKGIAAIVVDHHLPSDDLPDAVVIIDQWVNDSGYHWNDVSGNAKAEISGCAVVYKLVSALRFAQSDFYKQDITLLNVRPVNEAYTIECIKTRNLVPTARIEETIVPGTVSIMQTRLPSFLSGQQIFVWDAELITKLLRNTFGSGIEFNMFDIRSEISKVFPQTRNLSLLSLKDKSKLAKYGNHPATEIGGFYNIFVSYVQQKLKTDFPSFTAAEEKDLQLTALAALADIMPLRDENRIFVRQGIALMNKGKIRNGLVELFSELNILGKRINSQTLSWDVISNLNAAGRLGHAKLSAELLLEKDAGRRTEIAREIIQLNQKRKEYTSSAEKYARQFAVESISKNSSKLCLIIDREAERTDGIENINRGVSGIVAQHLVGSYGVPAIVVTFSNNIYIGSIRSNGYDISGFLSQLSDLFINYGGHPFAGGFSFEKERLAEFERRVQELSAIIELPNTDSSSFDIDAEIPAQFLTPELLDVTDRFEPFGEENPELIYMAKNLPVTDAVILGKGEKQHLKLTLSTGKLKWPALFWNEGERLNRDFSKGDKVDILFHTGRNFFNGSETPQLILLDLKKSTI